MLRMEDRLLGKTVTAYFGMCAGCAYWERNIPPLSPLCGICIVGRGETKETDYHFGKCYRSAYQSDGSIICAERTIPNTMTRGNNDYIV